MTCERARNDAVDCACGTDLVAVTNDSFSGCCVVDNTSVCIYDEIVHNSLSIIPSATIYL
jgi:hypothetical protein